MAERPPCDVDEAAAWFAGRIPDDWFDGPVSVRADRDEIIVTGNLPTPTNAPDGEDAARVAAATRISAFREETRRSRMTIADSAQHRWRRHVSWAATCGPEEAIFTSASVPVMTRLRFDDRQVLDTLIDTGVARSRSEAMAWCVGQVGRHQGEWIDRLREAMTEVEKIRAEGPG
jgi:hypothetical protein